MNNNQTIKCGVESCKYQNASDCTLGAIQVGCDCGSHDAKIEQETICRSFECAEEKTNM